MSGAMHSPLLTLMSGLPPWVSNLVAMVLVGFVIQWMDDALDSEVDLSRGERRLAVRMGRGLLPYGLGLMVLGAAFNFQLTAALFLSSYAVGMFSNLTERLTTRVPAYVETVIALLLSVAVSGWQVAAFAFCFIAFIDWLDDVVDYRKDLRSGGSNLALRIGMIETSLLVLLAMLGAVWLNALDTLLGLIAFATVTVIAEVTVQHLWTRERDSEVEKHDLF